MNAVIPLLLCISLLPAGVLAGCPDTRETLDADGLESYGINLRVSPGAQRHQSRVELSAQPSVCIRTTELHCKLAVYQFTHLYLIGGNAVQALTIDRSNEFAVTSVFTLPDTALDHTLLQLEYQGEACDDRSARRHRFLLRLQTVWLRGG